MRPALLTIFSALALLAALLGGCGADGETEGASSERAVPGPSDPEAPLISYARSGGFAFTSVELDVQAGGDATMTVQSGPKPQTQRFELEAAELETLRDLVAAVDPEAIDVETDVACADCFEYLLVFPRGEKIAFADVPGPPPELEPLLDELNQIVDGKGADDFANGG
jgi:hypothetical protein